MDHQVKQTIHMRNNKVDVTGKFCIFQAYFNLYYPKRVASNTLPISRDVPSLLAMLSTPPYLLCCDCLVTSPLNTKKNAKSKKN